LCGDVPCNLGFCFWAKHHHLTTLQYLVAVRLIAIDFCFFLTPGMFCSGKKSTISLCIGCDKLFCLAMHPGHAPGVDKHGRWQCAPGRATNVVTVEMLQVNCFIIFYLSAMHQ